MTDSHSSLPDSTPASPVPDSVSQNRRSDRNRTEPGDDVPEDVSHLPEEHQRVMQRLARRVKEAVTTIDGLRAENERLRRRVEELEAQPDYPEDETVLALDDDPDAVRERITQFINTIDAYLETSATAADNAADDEPDA